MEEGGRDGLREGVQKVLERLAPGEVVSYGDVAAEAGFPGSARAVGRVLASLEPGSALPWWRVVTATGRLVPGHEREHARLLRAEGVEMRGGRVARAGSSLRVWSSPRPSGPPVR